MTSTLAVNSIPGPSPALDPRPASTSRAKTFAEFFAGIGLVGEGLAATGWECVYANDVSLRKMQMHADRNGPSPCYHLGDVRDTEAVVARVVRNPFLATASFPCVDLSTAGNYRGFGGEHSSTFFAFVDVLKALGDRRPKLVVLENVVGFLSSRKGADFAAAASALADLGYWIDAFVLDARHFVPQSRPRVFVVAVSDELNRAAALGGGRDDLLGLADAEPGPLRPAAVVRLLRSLPLATGWAPLALRAPPRRRLELADVVDLDGGQDWWGPAQVDRHHRMMSPLHRGRVDALVESGSAFVGTIFRRVRTDGQRAEVRFDGLAGCLRTPRGGSGRQIVIAVDGGRLRMRWMSPREYARLQGAPDFPLPPDRPASQLLLGFADAVCVPAVAWIDRNVLTPLFDAAFAIPAPRPEPGRARQPHP